MVHRELPLLLPRPEAIAVCKNESRHFKTTVVVNNKTDRYKETYTFKEGKLEEYEYNDGSLNENRTQ
jgi:hypothetical protein